MPRKKSSTPLNCNQHPEPLLTRSWIRAFKFPHDLNFTARNETVTRKCFSLLYFLESLQTVVWRFTSEMVFHLLGYIDWLLELPLFLSASNSLPFIIWHQEGIFVYRTAAYRTSFYLDGSETCGFWGYKRLPQWVYINSDKGPKKCTVEKCAFYYIISHIF